MLKTETVRARIEPAIKKKAEIIFQKFGLNSSKAITIFFHRVCLDNGFPFEFKIPNAETLKAMDDVDNNRNLIKCKDAQDMFKKLKI